MKTGPGFYRVPHISLLRCGNTTLKRLCILAALAALFFIPVPSFACSACRDMSAGSAPQARAGLRKGIMVLGIPAAGLFAGILILAFKTKPHPEESHPEQARQKDQHRV